MHVSIDNNTSTLRDPIEAMKRGEDVVFFDADTPVAKLEIATRSGFRFGLLANVLKGPAPDFLEPMSEEDLAMWEGGKSVSR